MNLVNSFMRMEISWNASSNTTRWMSKRIFNKILAEIQFEKSVGVLMIRYGILKITWYELWVNIKNWQVNKKLLRMWSLLNVALSIPIKLIAFVDWIFENITKKKSIQQISSQTNKNPMNKKGVVKL